MNDVISLSDWQKAIDQEFPDLSIEVADYDCGEEPYFSGVYGRIERHALKLPEGRSGFNCSLLAIEKNSVFSLSSTVLIESWAEWGTRRVRRKCWLLGEKKDTYFPGKYFFCELPGHSSRFPDFEAVHRWYSRLRGKRLARINEKLELPENDCLEKSE